MHHDTEWDLDHGLVAGTRFSQIEREIHAELREPSACQGVAMIILIRETTPRADIELGITRLREKRTTVRDKRALAEIDHDIDDLLELWAAAGEGP